MNDEINRGQDDGSQTTGKRTVNGQVLELPTLDSIEQEASEWVSLLDRGPSSDEIREFKSWMSRSKRHRDVVFAMAELWDRMDVPSIISDTENREVIPIDDWREDENEPRFFSSILVSLIIIVGLFSAGVYFVDDMRAFVSGQYDQSAHHERVYKNPIGKVTHHALPDGSKLVLGTGSIASANFSEDLRSIVLDKGELHITVAKETNRPLILVVNGRLIRAMASAFNVRYLDKEQVEVYVTNGYVLISQPTQEEERAIDEVLHQPLTNNFRVVKGRAVVLGDGIESVVKLTPQERYSKAFWRSGKLLFTGENLVYAASEFQRFSDIEIAFADEQTRQIRVNGLFDVADVDTFLTALEQEHALHVNKINSKYIELKSFQ